MEWDERLGSRLGPERGDQAHTPGPGVAATPAAPTEEPLRHPVAPLSRRTSGLLSLTTQGGSFKGWSQGGILGGRERRLAFDQSGVDRVEFLIAANPGEEPKGLHRMPSTPTAPSHGIPCRNQSS